jgi:hypothetical protein
MAKIPVTNQDWLELIVRKRRESMIAGLKEALEIVEGYETSVDAVSRCKHYTGNKIRASISRLEANTP